MHKASMARTGNPTWGVTLPIAVRREATPRGSATCRLPGPARAARHGPASRPAFRATRAAAREPGLDRADPEIPRPLRQRGGRFSLHGTTDLPTPPTRELGSPMQGIV